MTETCPQCDRDVFETIVYGKRRVCRACFSNTVGQNRGLSSMMPARWGKRSHSVRCEYCRKRVARGFPSASDIRALTWAGKACCIRCNDQFLRRMLRQEFIKQERKLTREQMVWLCDGYFSYGSVRRFTKTFHPFSNKSRRLVSHWLASLGNPPPIGSRHVAAPAVQRRIARANDGSLAMVVSKESKERTALDEVHLAGFMARRPPKPEQEQFEMTLVGLMPGRFREGRYPMRDDERRDWDGVWDNVCRAFEEIDTE